MISKITTSLAFCIICEAAGFLFEQFCRTQYRLKSKLKQKPQKNGSLSLKQSSSTAN